MSMSVLFVTCLPFTEVLTIYEYIYPGSRGSLRGERNERRERSGLAYSNVCFPNRFDIFLQMANHMRDSNSEPNQVWKWDLQSM